MKKGEEDIKNKTKNLIPNYRTKLPTIGRSFQPTMDRSYQVRTNLPSIGRTYVPSKGRSYQL